MLLVNKHMTDRLNISQQFYNDLKAFIGTKVENPEDVNDILQDSLYKAQKNIHLLKKDSKFTSWLYQIIRNSIIDFYRKKRVNIDIDEANIEDQNWQIDENDNKQLSKCLKSLIEELPDNYRDALLLFEISGMGLKDLSTHLSLTISGTKSRIQRGREKLREIILKCCTVNTDKYGNVVNHKCNKASTGCC